MQMNLYEQSVCLLRLCPIPQSIQQLIYYTLIGYGTPTTNALQTNALQTTTFLENYDVRFANLNRNRLSLHAMGKKMSYYCNKPSHFSRYTLYELHYIYLNVNKNNYSEQYMITRNEDMQNLLRDLTKKRLRRLIVEEEELTFGHSLVILWHNLCKGCSCI